MGSVNIDDLPQQSVLLMDSPPIIYMLESHPELEPRFRPVFEAHAEGRVQLATTTIAIAEVLSGPLRGGDEALAKRYRAILESWHIVELDVDIAESAARFKATLGLKLADAIQAASALAINAAALVTYDRDFSKVRSLRIVM